MSRAAPKPSEIALGEGGLPRYVSAKAFREALDISDRAFRRGLSANRIPSPDLRWGRSLRWRMETVQDFFESLEAKNRGGKTKR